MKKQLIAAALLLLTAVFYFSAISTGVVAIMLLVDVSLFYVISLAILVVILIGYAVAFKLNPQFKQTVFWFIEEGSPLS